MDNLLIAETLLPCPFCGGEAVIEDLGEPDDDSFAHCEDCGVQQIADFTRREAARMWNTRKASKLSRNRGDAE
jgi:Lar family restriction alleviation protein